MKTSFRLTPLADEAQPQPVNFAGRSRLATLLNAPMLYAVATVMSAAIWLLGSRAWAVGGLCGLVVWPALAVMHFELSGATWALWKNKLLNTVGGRSRPSPLPGSVD